MQFMFNSSQTVVIKSVYRNKYLKFTNMQV